MLLPIALLFATNAAPSNHIIAENKLPGAPPSEWDVNGAGSYDIQGFSTRASLEPGEIVSFKIKLASPEPFRVDIYRLGYYGGAGARKIGTAQLVASAEQTAAGQPECDAAEPAAQLVDCGNWATVATFELPANATSGLYFGRPTLLTPNSNWRTDDSRHKIDPLHSIAGRDPSLPPDGTLAHAYGASGRNRLRNALTLPRASHAWFVVRDKQDAPNRDLLFQTADLTWHAYNGWGGYTTYGSFDYPREHAPARRLMDVADPNAQLTRAHKRSYNTPLITRDYRAVNMPLSAEYPAIRFLERNGYSLHYCAGVDLAVAPRNAQLLRRSRAYLSVGHDEYWTRHQRDALEAARDVAERWRGGSGLHLNFWSANEAYWSVRLECSKYDDEGCSDDDHCGGGGGGDDDSGGGGSAHGDAPRTLVCYKETQALVKLDPMADEWTGTFRDARPINPRGARPENALSGTMFAANAQRHDALVVDGARFGRHRAWRGTAAQAQADELDVSGDDASTVPPLVMQPGILGHEWDEDVDNGWRPAGLQTLSETVVDNVQVIMDHGATFDTGSATHSLVLHRRPPPSRAWVFGAATVQWSWGLDGHHDVNDPPRQNKYAIRVGLDRLAPCRDVQRLTLNVLADQGVRPRSLEPALSSHARHLRPSSDDEPPVVYDVNGYFSAHRGVIVVEGRASDVGGSDTGGGGDGDGGGGGGGGGERRAGVVAAVEVSWDGGTRWHAATIAQLLTDGAKWSLTWGHAPWHALHGNLPAPPSADDARSGGVAVVVRATDDSGNSGTGTAVIPLGNRTVHKRWKGERRAEPGASSKSEL